MRCRQLTNTALDTKDTPWSFGVAFLNMSAGTLVVEGSDTSASTGYTDQLSLATLKGGEIAGRLPRWIRVKTAAELTMLGN